MMLRVWTRWLVLMCAFGAASSATAAGEPTWLLNAAAKGDTAKVVEQLRHAFFPENSGEPHDR